jgi:subtilisin family serine protease
MDTFWQHTLSQLPLQLRDALLAARKGEEAIKSPADTVVAKLKDTTPAAVQRVILSAARETTVANVRKPLFATLVESGYVAEIIPIYPGDGALRGAGERVPAGLHAGMEANVRALAAAVTESSLRRKSRGLVSVKVAPGVNPGILAADLNAKKDEVEYAFVPPPRYPFLAAPATRRTRGSRRQARATNDPLASRQWNHGAVQIHAARSRSGFKDGSGVIVAVVDSGIDNGHPDLDGSLHSYINFLEATEDDHDYSGHGTHVAGIIAAEVNNRLGVAGLCAAKIMALKALPKRGNTWNAEKYYQALGYPMDNGAKILNLSLGGQYDRAEADIIADLLDAGVTVVAAMGNEYTEGNPTSYPAAYDGVIAVGATDEADRRARFSCTGRHIALMAPGVNILSTVPRYPSTFASTVDYDSWPGTSMAAPHVAAAAALLLAKSPNLGPHAVRQRVIDTADRVPGQMEWNEEYGAGRLNISAALA